MIIIKPGARQFSIPDDDLVFGVEFDAGSERKYFQCTRYVGDNIDLSGCFVRVNFRNANGDMDSYLVDDVAVDGDNVTFSWVLSHKAVEYKGQVKFVVCAVGPDQKVEWHTTLGTGMVLEGLEPDTGAVLRGTADVVAQLITMVEQQTDAVKAEGAKQVKAVQDAAKTAETASVAEIEAKGVNTRESIPDDYTTLQSAVDVLTRTVAPGVVCEATGPVVAVSDASDNHIQGLRIFGRSTQDGVPTPEAPVEIVSVENPVVTVCGKNLLPNAATNESYNGITIVVNEDKSITVNGTATGNVFYAPYKFTFKAGVPYVLSGCPKDGSADTYFVYINNLGGMRDYGNGVLVNLDEDFTSDVGFSIRSGTSVSNLTFYPMVKVGTVIDDYEPRKPIQTVELTHTLPGIPVTSGGNYTDENGQQWICDEVDLERGVYVQRVCAETFSGGNADYWWEYNSTGFEGYARPLSNMRWGLRWNGYCNLFPAHLGSSTEPGLWFGADNNVLYLHSAKELFPTLDQFKAWLTDNPMVVIYPLATPVETPLSETEVAAYRALHSNYPHTTVLNDSGAHLAVKYVADTKLYIDNKIAAIAAQK